MLADELPATNYEICLNHGKHNQDLSALSLCSSLDSVEAKMRKEENDFGLGNHKP